MDDGKGHLRARLEETEAKLADTVRARNYAMRQRDEERAAKEGNIRALNAAIQERDELREKVAALTAEAELLRRHAQAQAASQVMPVIMVQHQPCCQACNGTGGGYDGPCTDCYGTGCAHPLDGS